MLLSRQSEEIRRVDFDLKSYMERDNFIALWQILNTVLPLALVSVLIVKLTYSFSLLALFVVPVLFALIILLMSRSFSLMHDCGHLSLFRSKRANRIAAFGLSIIHGIPHYPWSRGHAFHHKYNGNWDRYRGPSALTTKQNYEEKTPKLKSLYKILRHPLLLFPGGFYYLIIKPRIALLFGFFEFLFKAFRDLFNEISSGKLPDLFKIIRSQHSSFFYTKGEVIDTFANTVCVVAAWLLIGTAIGHWHFWILYCLIMSCSAALMIAVFFIQHNFPGSYASNQAEWSYFKGAIEGSSFLQMPEILNWFTADIAYHHIHHLSERIPNYRLRQCHQANIHLAGNVRLLYLHELPACFSLILWDDEKLELISAIDQTFGT